MKKSFLLAAVCTMFMAACQSESVGFINETDEIPSDWRRQIELVKNTPEKTRVFGDEAFIKLVDYEYVGRINTEKRLEEVKEQIRHGVVPYFRRSPEEFVGYIPLTDIPGIAREGDESYGIISSVEARLKALVTVGKKVLRLTWDNNGTKITSLCIVDNEEGIVQDNIIDYLLFSEKVTPLNSKLSSPLVKTRNAEVGGGDDGELWWRTWVSPRNMIEKDWTGRIKYQAESRLSVEYSRNKETGLNTIHTIKPESYSYRSEGYWAHASTNTVSVYIEVDGMYHWAWAVGGGKGEGSVSFNGAGYSHTGTGKMYSGEEMWMNND